MVQSSFNALFSHPPSVTEGDLHPRATQQQQTGDGHIHPAGTRETWRQAARPSGAMRGSIGKWFNGI